MLTQRWKLPKVERNSIDDRISRLKEMVKTLKWEIANLEEQLRLARVKLVHSEAALEHLEKDFPE